MATIRSKDKRSPFKLKVVQTDKGVFFDLLDTVTDDRRFIISVTPRSARLLARWILNNVEER